MKDDRQGIRVPGTDLVTYGFSEAEVLSWRAWTCEKHRAHGFDANPNSLGCPFCAQEARTPPLIGE
jgi:hypothetical protein